MIKDDRKQLNDRFIHAFKLLEEQGVIKKNDRKGKGMGDVAERMLENRQYGHIVRAFLNNERFLEYHSARRFCEAYGVNEEWMINGIGQPFGEVYAQVVTTEDNQPRIITSGNILLTTVEAFAGNTIGVESRETQRLFSLPGLTGNGLVAFPINGNSMEPVINDGDLIVCREVSSLQDIRDNQIYAVRSNGMVWVKYIQRIHNKQGRIVKLKMLSANYLEYDPFEEDLNENTRIFKVIRRVSAV